MQRAKSQSRPSKKCSSRHKRARREDYSSSLAGKTASAFLTGPGSYLSSLANRDSSFDTFLFLRLCSQGKEAESTQVTYMYHGQGYRGTESVPATLRAVEVVQRQAWSKGFASFFERFNSWLEDLASQNPFVACYIALSDLACLL